MQFVIVDDDLNNGKALIHAITKLGYSKVTFIRPSINKKAKCNFDVLALDPSNFQHSVELKVVNNQGQLAASLEKVTENSIIFYDLQLGIVSGMLNHLESPMLSSLNKLANSIKLVIAIHSKESNPDTLIDSFNDGIAYNAKPAVELIRSDSDDMMTFVKEAVTKWNEIHRNPNLIVLNNYLSSMTKHSMVDCHDFDTGFIPLCTLLGYEDTELKKKLNITPKNTNKKVMQEFLVTTGILDASIITFLLSTFIAWAAYRRHFPDGKGNDLFIKAISTFIAKQEHKETARYSSITAEKNTASHIKNILTSLYEFFLSILIHKDNSWINRDTLLEVELSQKGVCFTLVFPPTELIDRLNEIAKNTYDALRSPDIKIKSHHSVSHRILELLVLSNVSSVKDQEDDSFIGTEFPFYIKKYESGMTKIGFGNDH